MATTSEGSTSAVSSSDLSSVPPVNSIREDEPAGAGEVSKRPATRHKPGLLARLAIVYYVTTFGASLWIFIACLVLCWRYSWLNLLFIPYLYYSFGPGARAPERGEWPTPFRNWGMWRVMARYFDSPRIIKTADLDSSKPYIFCFHPHGVLTFSAWLAFCTNALGFDKLYPGLDLRALTVRINFRTIIFREYILLHGLCDVSQHTCLNILSKGKSVLIAVGGAAESLLSRPGSNELVLRRRKGFVKVALRSGASLVPVYSFGETNTYSTLNSLPQDSLLRRLQARMQKAWGWTIPIYWGRGFFLPWGMLPYPVPLNTVIGAPIEVPKFHGDPHSAEFHALVDKYHRMYIEALTELFEQNKEKYAKGEMELKIVE